MKTIEDYIVIDIYVPVYGHEENAEYRVSLEVGVQKFCVTPIPYDNLEEAYFMKRQLSIALKRLMEEMNGPEKN